MIVKHTLGKINFCPGLNINKGNRAFADLRYRTEYSISYITLIFAATKG